MGVYFKHPNYKNQTTIICPFLEFKLFFLINFAIQSPIGAKMVYFVQVEDI
jgi:hypothetical protein